MCHRTERQGLDANDAFDNQQWSNRVTFNAAALLSEATGLTRRLYPAKRLQLQHPDITHAWIGSPIVFGRLIRQLLAHVLHQKSDPEGVVIQLHHHTVGHSVKAELRLTDFPPRFSQRRAHKPRTQADQPAKRSLPEPWGGAAELCALMKGDLQYDADRHGCGIYRLKLRFRQGPRLSSRTQHPIAEAHNNPLSGQTILLADDVPLIRQINKHTLERLGACVLEAVDGRHALQLLQSTTCDVAMLDIDMPRLSGLQVAKAVRQQSPQNSPYLLALSAFANATERTRYLQAGFDSVLPKPLDAQKIVDLLHLPQRLTPVQSLASLAVTDTAHKTLLRRYNRTVSQTLRLLMNALNGGSAHNPHKLLHQLKGLAGLQSDPTLIRRLHDISLACDTTASRKKLNELFNDWRISTECEPLQLSGSSEAVVKK